MMFAMSGTGLASAQRRPTAAIVVAALGYFVDVYDIWLFSVLRKASLAGIGIPLERQRAIGEALLNWQMGGFVAGAVIFGIIADRRGRLAVLFSSILLYSLANLANAAVTDYWGYAACRFVAGIGLAGELGAGVALVSELVKAEGRGWATTFVASVGVAGSVAAPIVGSLTEWRMSYVIGGVMGLALLGLRVGVFESSLFEAGRKREDIRRGDLRALFANGERTRRYLATILVGTPVWFFAGLMMTFAPEIQAGLGISDPVAAPLAVGTAALGLTIGDVLFGGLSQGLKSRKRAFLLAYAWMTLGIAAILLFARDGRTFLGMMFFTGLGAGFWAVFVTTCGETFGTNLRGTVATTAASFVRGLVIPLVLLRNALERPVGFIPATAAVGTLVLVLALWSVAVLPETYGRDLDFYEEG